MDEFYFNAKSKRFIGLAKTNKFKESQRVIEYYINNTLRGARGYDTIEGA